VTQSRVERGAHQAVAIKVWVYCVRVCNFSIIACIVSVLVQKLVKNKGVPSLFVSSLQHTGYYHRTLKTMVLLTEYCPWLYHWLQNNFN
jgi:hypothetical protein